MTSSSPTDQCLREWKARGETGATDEGSYKQHRKKRCEVNETALDMTMCRRMKVWVVHDLKMIDAPSTPLLCLLVYLKQPANIERHCKV